MKRKVILSLLLAFVMLFAVSACNAVEPVTVKGFEVASELTVTKGAVVTIEKPLATDDAGNILDIWSDVTDKNGGIVTVTSGSFIATDLGGYTITYATRTSDGVTHKRTTKIIVKETVTELSAEFNKYEDVGTEVTIKPICDVSNATLTYAVKHNDTDVVVSADGKFTPSSTGKYDVTITATAAGKSISYDYTFYARTPNIPGEVETYGDDWVAVNNYAGKNRNPANNRGEWTITNTAESGLYDYNGKEANFAVYTVNDADPESPDNYIHFKLNPRNDKAYYEQLAEEGYEWVSFWIYLDGEDGGEHASYAYSYHLGGMYSSQEPFDYTAQKVSKIKNNEWTEIRIPLAKDRPGDPYRYSFLRRFDYYVNNDMTLFYIDNYRYENSGLHEDDLKIYVSEIFAKKKTDITLKENADTNMEVGETLTFTDAFDIGEDSADYDTFVTFRGQRTYLANASGYKFTANGDYEFEFVSNRPDRYDSAKASFTVTDDITFTADAIVARLTGDNVAVDINQSGVQLKKGETMLTDYSYIVRKGNSILPVSGTTFVATEFGTHEVEVAGHYEVGGETYTSYQTIPADILDPANPYWLPVASGNAKGGYYEHTYDQEFISVVSNPAGRTGKYYKLDDATDKKDAIAIGLLPAYSKAYYDSLDENISLVFDYYLSFGGVRGSYLDLMGANGNDNPINNTWLTHSIPVKTIVENYDYMTGELGINGVPKMKRYALNIQVGYDEDTSYANSYAYIGNIRFAITGADLSATASVSSSTDTYDLSGIVVKANEGETNEVTLSNAVFTTQESGVVMTGNEFFAPFNGSYSVQLVSAVDSDGLVYYPAETVTTVIDITGGQALNVKGDNTLLVDLASTTSVDVETQATLVSAMDDLSGNYGYEYTFYKKKGIEFIDTEVEYSGTTLDLTGLDGIYLARIQAVYDDGNITVKKDYFDLVIDVYNSAEGEGMIAEMTNAIVLNGTMIDPTLDNTVEENKHDDYFSAIGYNNKTTVEDGVATIKHSGYIQVNILPKHTKEYYQKMIADLTAEGKAVPNLTFKVSYQGHSDTWPRGYANKSEFNNGLKKDGSIYTVTASLENFVNAYDKLVAWYEFAQDMNGRTFVDTEKHSSFLWVSITGTSGADGILTVSDITLENTFIQSDISVTVNGTPTAGEEFDLESGLTVKINGVEATDIAYEVYGTGYTLNGYTFNTPFGGTYAIKMLSATAGGIKYTAASDTFVSFEVAQGEQTITEQANKSALVNITDSSSVTVSTYATFDEITVSGYAYAYEMYKTKAGELKEQSDAIVAETGVITTAGLKGTYRVITYITYGNFSKEYFVLDLDFYAEGESVVADSENMLATYMYKWNSGAGISSTPNTEFDGKSGLLTAQSGSAEAMVLAMNPIHTKEYYETVFGDDYDKYTVSFDIYAVFDDSVSNRDTHNLVTDKESDGAKYSVAPGRWYTISAPMSEFMNEYGGIVGNYIIARDGTLSTSTYDYWILWMNTYNVDRGLNLTVYATEMRIESTFTQSDIGFTVNGTPAAGEDFDLTSGITVTVNGVEATNVAYELYGTGYTLTDGKFNTPFSGTYAIKMLSATVGGMNYTAASDTFVSIEVTGGEQVITEHAKQSALIDTTEKSTVSITDYITLDDITVSGYAYAYKLYKLNGNTLGDESDAIANGVITTEGLKGTYRAITYITYGTDSKEYFVLDLDFYDNSEEAVITAKEDMFTVSGDNVEHTFSARYINRAHTFESGNGYINITIPSNDIAMVVALPAHSKAYYQAILDKYGASAPTVSVSAVSTNNAWGKGLIYAYSDMCTESSGWGMQANRTYTAVLTLEQFIANYDILVGWYDISQSLDGSVKNIANNGDHKTFIHASFTAGTVISISDIKMEGSFTEASVTVNKTVNADEDFDLNNSENLTVTINGKTADSVTFETAGSGYTLTDGVFNSAFAGTYTVKITSAVVDGMNYTASGEVTFNITVAGTLKTFEKGSVLVDKSQGTLDLNNSTQNGGAELDDLTQLDGYSYTYALYTLKGIETSIVDNGVTAAGVIDLTALEDGQYRAIVSVNKGTATKEYYAVDIDLYDSSATEVVVADISDYIALTGTGVNDYFEAESVNTSGSVSEGKITFAEVKYIQVNILPKHSKAYYEKLIADCTTAGRAVPTLTMEMGIIAHDQSDADVWPRGYMYTGGLNTGETITVTKTLQSFVNAYDKLIAWYEFAQDMGDAKYADTEKHSSFYWSKLNGTSGANGYLTLSNITLESTFSSASVTFNKTVNAGENFDLNSSENITVTIDGKTADSVTFETAGSGYTLTDGVFNGAFAGSYTVKITSAVVGGMNYTASGTVTFTVNAEGGAQEITEQAKQSALVNTAEKDSVTVSSYATFDTLEDGYSYEYEMYKLNGNTLGEENTNINALTGVIETDGLNGTYRVITYITYGEFSKEYFVLDLDFYASELDATVISVNNMLGMTGVYTNPDEASGDTDKNDDYFEATTKASLTIADGKATFAPNGWGAMAALPVHSKAYYENMLTTYGDTVQLTTTVSYAGGGGEWWPRGWLYLTNSSTQVSKPLNSGLVSDGTPYTLTMTIQELIDAYDKLVGWYDIAQTVNGTATAIENNTKHSSYWWGYIAGGKSTTVTDLVLVGNFAQSATTVTVNKTVNAGEDFDLNNSENLTVTINGKTADSVTFETAGSGYTLTDGVFNSAFAGTYTVKITSAVVDGMNYTASGEVTFNITSTGGIEKLESKSVLFDISTASTMDVKDSTVNGGVSFATLDEGYSYTYALYKVDGSETSIVDGGISSSGVITTTGLDGTYQVVVSVTASGLSSEYFTLDIDFYDGASDSIVFADLADIVAMGGSLDNTNFSAVTERIAPTSVTLEGRKMNKYATVGYYGIGFTLKLKHSKAYYQLLADNGGKDIIFEMYTDNTTNAGYGCGLLHEKTISPNTWQTSILTLTELLNGYDKLVEWYEFSKTLTGSAQAPPDPTRGNLLYAIAGNNGRNVYLTGGIYSTTIETVTGESTTVDTATTYTVPSTVTLDTDKYYYYTTVGSITAQGTSVDISSITEDGVYSVTVNAFEKNTGVLVGTAYTSTIIIGDTSSVSFAEMSADAVTFYIYSTAYSDKGTSSIVDASQTEIYGRTSGKYYAYTTSASAGMPGLKFTPKEDKTVYTAFADGYMVFDYLIDSTTTSLTTSFAATGYSAHDSSAAISSKKWYTAIIPMSAILDDTFWNGIGTNSYCGIIIRLSESSYAAGLTFYVGEIKIVESLDGAFDGIDEQAGFAYQEVNTVGATAVNNGSKTSGLSISDVDTLGVADGFNAAAYSTKNVYVLDCATVNSTNPGIRIAPTYSNAVFGAHKTYNLEFSFYLASTDQTALNVNGVIVKTSETTDDTTYRYSGTSVECNKWHTVSVPLTSLESAFTDGAEDYYTFFSKAGDFTNNQHHGKMLALQWQETGTTLYANTDVYISEIRVVPATQA